MSKKVNSQAGGQKPPTAANPTRQRHQLGVADALGSSKKKKTKKKK